MSLYDYRTSRELTTRGIPFNALIMAAMQMAKGRDAQRLRGAFPELWSEAKVRDEVLDGTLPEEEV